MRILRRFLPLLVIIGIALAVWIMGWVDYLSIENLYAHRMRLLKQVSLWPTVAVCSYILLYALTAALSIPGGAALSILGGFLFSQPFATLYVVCGATLGATLLFLAAKTSIGDFFRERAGPRIKKIEQNIGHNIVYYLLFLRLIPLFPFWLVNLASAFAGIPVRTFIWTTAVGILPGAFAFTQAGVGLGSILDRGEQLSLGNLLTVETRIALFALGTLALLPVLYNSWRVHKEEQVDVGHLSKTDDTEKMD